MSERREEGGGDRERPCGAGCEVCASAAEELHMCMVYVNVMNACV